MFYLLQLTEEEEIEALRGEVICISFCNSVAELEFESRCTQKLMLTITLQQSVLLQYLPQSFLSCSPWWYKRWEFRQFLLVTPPFPFWSVLVRVLFYRWGEWSRLEEAWYWSGIPRNRATWSTQFVLQLPRAMYLLLFLDVHVPRTYWYNNVYGWGMKCLLLS